MPFVCNTRVLHRYTYFEFVERGVTEKKLVAAEESRGTIYGTARIFDGILQLFTTFRTSQGRFFDKVEEPFTARYVFSTAFYCSFRLSRRVTTDFLSQSRNFLLPGTGFLRQFTDLHGSHDTSWQIFLTKSRNHLRHVTAFFYGILRLLHQVTASHDKFF